MFNKILGFSKWIQHDKGEHNEGWWHIYASRSCVNIGLGDGMALIQWQAITWINDDLLSIGHIRTHFSKTGIKTE